MYEENRRRSEDRWSRNTRRAAHRGSFTVEAALLMSVILMALFLCLQMTLFLTDSVRMTAVAAEDLTYDAEEAAEREHWIAGQRGGFFFLDPGTLRHRADSGHVEEVFPEREVSFGYGVRAKAAQRRSRDQRDPVQYLWWIHRMRDLAD